jgi:hypothetical protein
MAMEDDQGAAELEYD